ncbi:MAG: hypothetical protein Q7S69_01130 [Nitrosomonadaceae bacterium]|nr:hypothetical protein [Nitrosomonadaceae bacterium]
MSDLVSFKFLSLLTDFTVRIDADSIIRQVSQQHPRNFLSWPQTRWGEVLRFFIQPEDMSIFTAAKDKAAFAGEAAATVSKRDTGKGLTELASRYGNALLVPVETILESVNLAVSDAKEPSILEAVSAPHGKLADSTNWPKVCVRPLMHWPEAQILAIP